MPSDRSERTKEEASDICVAGRAGYESDEPTIEVEEQRGMGASDPGHSVPDPLSIKAEEVMPPERISRPQATADGRFEQDGCTSSEHRLRAAVPSQGSEGGAVRLQTPAVGRRPITHA